jgi:hypothetical protein
MILLHRCQTSDSPSVNKHATRHTTLCPFKRRCSAQASHRRRRALPRRLRQLEQAHPPLQLSLTLEKRQQILQQVTNGLLDRPIPFDLQRQQYGKWMRRHRCSVLSLG